MNSKQMTWVAIALAGGAAAWWYFKKKKSQQPDAPPPVGDSMMPGFASVLPALPSPSIQTPGIVESGLLLENPPESVAQGSGPRFVQPFYEVPATQEHGGELMLGPPQVADEDYIA